MSSSAYAPTQETTNLNRVSHVLRCPCTDQLRDLLRHHVPPVLFPRVIQEKRTNLPRLTAPQRKLILPSTGHYTGDYSDMDVSLLYLLLRNICSIQPHIKGWGHTPDDADISLSACIESIREIRNKIGHSSSSGLSQVDFIDYWSNIKRSVKSIDKHLNNDSKYEKDVDCLLEASMDPEREAIYLDQLKSKVKTEGIEDLRSLVASINELEADIIQIPSFRMDDAIDLDRIYAHVSIIDEYDKRGSMRSEDSNFQCIAPDKIFTTQSRNLARFIFMLGEAGYGKTVQCQRFAKSWCQAWNNDTVRERDTRPQILDLNRCLKQFDFLFFIKMRDVSIQSENLIDLIQDVYSRCRLSKQNLADMRMILENGEFRSLVLVDGLDEWNISDDKKKLLLDKCIPNCRNMPGTTILISMRSWKFMEVEELCNPNIDRVIRLNGLDEDGVKELTTNMLSNYFQNKTTFDDFNERKTYVENAVSYAPTEIKSLMNIPMLTVFYILTLYEDVKTGNSLTTFYLSIIEAFFKRMSRKTQAEGISVGGFSISTFVRSLPEYLWNRFKQLLPRWLLPGGSLRTDCISLQEYPKVTQHLHELTLLGKVAFESLSSESSILVFSEDQLNQLLDEEIVYLFLRVGIVIKSETTGRFHEDKIRISFLHKTIHEFLASFYLIYGRKETDTDAIMKDVLSNVDKAIEYAPVLIFLSGLSPAVGCRISNFIKNTTNDDDDIKKYRLDFHSRSYPKIFHLYNLQLRCYKEVRRSKSIEAFEGDGQTLKFSFSDVILLSTDTDVPTIRESANVLKFHPNDIISLNMVCIPNNKEEGISNAEIKTFLDESQSITSIYIDGYVDGKCRLIDEYSPKMFHLKTLGLSNVSFRDNILANLITKKESKEDIRALGILYLKSAEDDVIDFEYRIPSIHWRYTTKSGFRRYAHPKTGANSDPQRKQRTPFLRIFLESLPDYKQLSILHITYMEAEEDRQKLLQVLPKLSQLHEIGYHGSNTYPNPDCGYDAKVISKITKLAKLQKVYLRSISLREPVLNFENMSTLKEITLDALRMHTANGWEMLFESFSKIETLQKIFLYDTNVEKEVLDEYKNIRESFCIEKMDRQTYEIL
ncbi:hypothetical protein FSP39_005909 [Pinctada imbricata]|uniref:NACHT domain-containing protein n=1 Tax=Pinctada imbricata TaxID=66713 RepID=A0AA88Y6T1_PINIB|nr:hypothetical protein FSP39_005909 [Pinctada imbricata]